MKNSRPKSQIEIDQNIIDFLGDLKIEKPEDLLKLRKHIQDSLKLRDYNEETKEHENSIRWKRTASEIIKDGYVYKGKACSDLSVVFLALCRVVGIDGMLVKLKSIDGKITHSIVEINLKGTWYRLDITMTDSIPFEGRLPDGQVWNKKFKVWKRGRDVWDLGLSNIDSKLKK